MLLPSTIKFLKDLKKNNNRDWFEKHRPAYDSAKTDFANFTQQVIDKFGKTEPSIKNLASKECMFRINRDVRFSKDKSPYKTNMGASINCAGRKAWEKAGYYFQLEPGRSFAGGGIWMPESPQLKKIRQEVDYNFNEFKKIISSKKFKAVFGDLNRSSEYVLTRIPKGYETDNPAAEFLKLKSFVAMRIFSEKELLSRDLVKKSVEAFSALQPLVEFINKID